MKYILIILVVAVTGAVFLYRNDIKASLTASESKGDNKGKNDKEQASQGVTVLHQWKLPDRLKEISGLSYIDAERFACVQDEEGVMFIYNAKDEKIEKEIPFGSAGDYEGITLVDNNAYVVRSDGTLFEITSWNNTPSTRQFKTSLTADHNVEGLVYDKAGNRLLLAIKADEPSTKDYKGIYAFDLTSKRFIAEPVYKINMNQAGSGGKKKGPRPSAIGIHPGSGDLFIVDGPASKLIVMDSKGEIMKHLNLGNSFEQPEGITFSPGGEIFVSSEGVKKTGTISKLEIR